MAYFFSWILSKLQKPLTENLETHILEVAMLFVVLFYFEMASCSLGWPQINYIAQTGLDPPTPNPLNSTS